MNTIITILFCVITIGFTYGQRNGCIDSADHCMQKTIIIGDPEVMFPLNNQEMNNYCGRMAGKEKCVKDNSKMCLKSLAAQVTGVLINGAVKNNKGYCTNAVRRRTFLKIGECANPRKTTLDGLMYSFVDTLQAIDRTDKVDSKIPLLCCNYQRFKSALLSEARNDVIPKCTERVIEEIEHLVDGYANDVLSLICMEEYRSEHSRECQTILPRTPPIIPGNRSRSILKPLVAIFNSFKH